MVLGLRLAQFALVFLNDFVRQGSHLGFEFTGFTAPVPCFVLSQCVFCRIQKPSQLLGVVADLLKHVVHRIVRAVG